VWPKRGPVTSRSWGQQRSASRTLAGKETPPAAPDKRARLAIALLGGALAGSRPGTSPLCRRCPWSAKLYPSALLVQTVHTTMAVWEEGAEEPMQASTSRPLTCQTRSGGIVTCEGEEPARWRPPERLSVLVRQELILAVTNGPLVARAAGLTRHTVVPLAPA
jgi:hypothetical protein